MQAYQPSILARDDTFFGVCQALGEDLGFSPQILRVGFAVLLFFSPVAAIGGYAAAGMVVALTRWLVPNPRIPISDTSAVEDETQPANADNQMELALAA